MTLKEAYKEYREYYKNNQWKWDDVSYYLKNTLIDYEEYNFEEFKDKVLTDDKFNEKWSLGCTKHIDIDGYRELYPELNEIHEQKIKHVKAQEYEKARVLREKEKEIISTLPKRIIIE